MARDNGSDDIDVVSTLGGLRSNLPRLFVSTIIVGALAYGLFSTMAPRYEAKTQLSIIAKSTNPFPDASKGANASINLAPRLDREAINTHVRALAAPDLLLSVARKLKLAERAEFNSVVGPVDSFDRALRTIGLSGPNAAESAEDRVLSVMKRQVEVYAARESRSITVRVMSTDAKLAAEIANTVAQTYRQNLVEVPVQETNQVIEALEPKIAQLNREVVEADAAAERFRAQTDQFRGGPQATSVTAQRMASLNDELVRAEAARTEAEAEWKTAHDLSLSGAAASLPQVQSSRVIQDLIAQRVRVERQVNEARAVLLPAHPRMRPLNQKLEGLRQAIRTEVARVVSSLEKRYRAAQLRVEDVQRQLDELKARVVSTSGNEAKLKSLENSARAKRVELERLQKQLEDNRTLAATRTVPVEAQIDSLARPSGAAVFPLKGKYTLLVMAATLMLGFVMISARELMLSNRPDSGVTYGRRATDRAPPGALAGVAPSQTSVVAPVGAAAEPFGAAFEEEEADSEAFATIADLAEYLGEQLGEDGGLRTMITGEADALDPSDEALDLVMELSSAGGNVVVIDWSVDGQPLFEDVDVGETMGLADLLAGRASFEDVIIPLPGTRLHYVASGRVQSDDEDLLDSDGLNLVLDALDEAYDHIVVAARFNAAQALFETIQGRFDTGITIAECARRGPSAITEAEPTYLGFEVTDIELIRYERPSDHLVSGRHAGLRGETVEAL